MECKFQIDQNVVDNYLLDMEDSLKNLDLVDSYHLDTSCMKKNHLLNNCPHYISHMVHCISANNNQHCKNYMYNYHYIKWLKRMTSMNPMDILCNLKNLELVDMHLLKLYSTYRKLNQCLVGTYL